MKQENFLNRRERIYYFFIRHLNYRINGRWSKEKWWQKQFVGVKNPWLNLEAYRLVKIKAFGRD